jgi:hypothetical protein
MPDNHIEKNQLIIKILFLLIKNKINSSIFKKTEEEGPQVNENNSPWENLQTRELSELQEIYHKLSKNRATNKNKQIPVHNFNYDNYGVLGILKPLINLVKSLFGSKQSNAESGFIGQLYKTFSSIRIFFNPEASLTDEEKKYSKYSKLFNMASDLKYKSFNKHYRELIKNNFTEHQILQKFFKLINDNSEVISKKNCFLLFKQAEKELLGGKITADGRSEILSKRVEENLNKVLKVYSVISLDNANDLQKKSNQIKIVKYITDKLVNQISKKELELEQFKLENKSEENKIKNALYQEILKHKKKLYSFILRTDAWSIGETLYQVKVFDLDYIHKQFDKFPAQEINNEKLLNYNFEDQIKHKGVLNLFENNNDNLKNDLEYQKNIKICKKEKIKQYLLDNIANSIKSYNYLNADYSAKISEIDNLGSAINDPYSETCAPQVTAEILRIQGNLSKLKGDKSRIAVCVNDFKERIISLLCDYYNMEEIADNAEHNEDETIKKIHEFIKHLSPTIMSKNLDDDDVIKLLGQSKDRLDQSINKNDIEYFNTLEKLKFFADKLNDEANTIVNSLKLNDKPINHNKSQKMEN